MYILFWNVYTFVMIVIVSLICFRVSCSGNEVGYTVVLPCQRCLQAPNNGHMWIFYSSAVIVSTREHGDGKEGTARRVCKKGLQEGSAMREQGGEACESWSLGSGDYERDKR